MSTEPNSTPAGESTTPASTPANTTNQPAKVSPFAGMPPPSWVKADPKLLEAHNAAEKSQQTGTKPEGEPPAVTPPTSAAPTTPPTTQTPPATTPPPTAPFDSESFARTLARELRPPTPTGTPAPTDAELRAQLNIFEVDAVGFEEVFGTPPRDEKQLAGYNRHLQGIARQAVTMANVMNQRALQQHQESLNPYITTVRTQEAERQKTIFFNTENPDLKGYEELTQKEFQLALSSGKKFPSAEAARKYVADQVRATLKSVGITPKAVGATIQPTNTTTAPKPSARTMTPTSVGGRSGASATGKPASKVEAVWGNKR